MSKHTIIFIIDQRSIEYENEMSISIFLAKIIGLYFIIIGLFTLLRYQDLEAAVKSLVGQKGTILLLAIITLMVGLLLVVSHNIWVFDWRLIITLIAWLIFIGGIFRLFFQDNIVRIWMWWIDHKNYFLGTTIFFFLIGCYLAYKGFIAYPHGIR